MHRGEIWSISLDAERTLPDIENDISLLEARQSDLRTDTDYASKGLYKNTMKKKDIDKLFSKLELTVRSTGHHYGWLMIDGVKILRVHYSHGKGDLCRYFRKHHLCFGLTRIQTHNKNQDQELILFEISPRADSPTGHTVPRFTMNYLSSLPGCFGFSIRSYRPQPDSRFERMSYLPESQTSMPSTSA